MADNFDLKKFLKESKALENLNPILKKDNLNEGDIRDKIKEMIINELETTEPNEDEDYSDYFFDIDTPEEGPDPEDLYGDVTVSHGEREPYKNIFREAKKKKDKEVEDVEITDTETTEEVPVEDTPAEEAPATGGGLEDIAADMEGTEGDLMDALMKALKISKGMGNEKLTTQIGNTLKFFVGEYIGGDNM
jgi:hypothetical protein